MASVRQAVSVVVVVCGSLLPMTALADSIDGNWCFRDGRHVEIQGPRIVTASGKTMAGDYSRHAFRYTIPAGETDGGQEAQMSLVNDETVLVRVGADAAAPPQTWRRCKPGIS